MTLSEIIREVEEIARGKDLTLARPNEILCVLRRMKADTDASHAWYQKIVKSHVERHELAENKLEAIRVVLIAAGCSDYTDDLPQMLEDFLGAMARQIQETEQELLAVKAYLSEVETDRARLRSLINGALDDAGMPQDLDVAVRLNFLVAQALLDRCHIEQLTGGGK